MDDQFVERLMSLDYKYILERLKPLFLKYLHGIPKSRKEDVLQEYHAICCKYMDRIVKEFKEEQE